MWRNFTYMFHGQQTSEISRTFLSATLGINYYKGILKPSSFAFLSLHRRAIVQWKCLALPFLSIVLPCSFDFRNLLRDHSSITSSNRWVGGVRKWQFLMIHSTVNHQKLGGWALKSQKHDDVIFEWSLIHFCLLSRFSHSFIKSCLVFLKSILF